MLSASGRKFQRPSLVALAVSMKQASKLSNFGTVKAKVQAMIDDLNAEAKEDENVYKKCTKELKENAGVMTNQKTNFLNLQALLETKKAITDGTYGGGTGMVMAEAKATNSQTMTF